MKKHSRTLLALIFGASLLVSACTTTETSSDVTGNWLQESGDAPFETVIVFGVAPDQRAREAFEDALARNITEAGARGIAGHRYARRTNVEELTTENVIEMIKQTGADAVLLTRMIDQEVAQGLSKEETILHVGPTVRVAQNEDASMTAVMASNYAVEVVPGSATIKANTVLESIVFRPLLTDQPVYRAMTDARFEFGPGDVVEEAALRFADAIARQLRQDDVIR